MEKDNKYYDIIKDLIINHKKFEGCEPILDEIIDDVYKHSKSVIGSVKDEDVIFSYLQKVVSVSVITVPKHMNFNNKQKHRTITTDINIPVKNSNNEKTEEYNNTTTQKLTEEKVIVQKAEKREDVKKANVEFVDKMINSIDTDSVIDMQKSVDDSDLFIDENLEDIQVQDELNNDETFSDFSDINEDAEVLDFNTEESDSLELENVLAEEDEVESLDSDTEVLDFNMEESDNIEPENVLAEEDEAELLDSDTEVLDFNTEETDNTEPENVLAEEEVESFNSDTEVLDFNTEESDIVLSDDNITESIGLDYDDSINIDYDNSVIETNDDSLEIFEPVEDLGLDSQDNTDKEPVSNETTEFRPVDYSMFNYTPVENDNAVDTTDIKDMLLNLNKQKPELYILKIFDLKYRQNLPISKIAEELNIDTKTVVSAIDEIVDLI